MFKAERKGDNLIITLPINEKPVASQSGKTLVVASSHGNQATGIVIDGKAVVIGVNAYIKADKAA